MDAGLPHPTTKIYDKIKTEIQQYMMYELQFHYLNYGSNEITFLQFSLSNLFLHYP